MKAIEIRDGHFPFPVDQSQDRALEFFYGFLVTGSPEALAERITL